MFVYIADPAAPNSFARENSKYTFCESITSLRFRLPRRPLYKFFTKLLMATLYGDKHISNHRRGSITEARVDYPTETESHTIALEWIRTFVRNSITSSGVFNRSSYIKSHELIREPIIRSTVYRRIQRSSNSCSPMISMEIINSL